MFTTRETVFTLTPATSATSRIVGLRTTLTVEGLSDRWLAKAMSTPLRFPTLASLRRMTTNVTSCPQIVPGVNDFPHHLARFSGIPDVDNDGQSGIASGRNWPRSERRDGRTSTASSRHREALWPVSYTHLRAHETRHDLVCRLLL